MRRLRKPIFQGCALQPAVGIIMGSQSDWETMRHAAETLETLGVAHEARIVSAHRTPKRLVAYAEGARERGVKVIIAGAGGAAHLPGMVASMTTLPVLGVWLIGWATMRVVRRPQRTVWLPESAA